MRDWTAGDSAAEVRYRLQIAPLGIPIGIDQPLDIELALLAGAELAITASWTPLDVGSEEATLTALAITPGVSSAAPTLSGEAVGADTDGDGVTDEQDCAPEDDTTWPGAPELCDGIDNDCSGAPDADEADGDLDGLAPSGGPPAPRRGAGLAFVQDGNAAWLVGGQGYYDLFAEVWMLQF